MARRRFGYRYRVRFSDCDAQGVVYHPRYLYLIDDAFTEFFRWAGLDYIGMRRDGLFDVQVVRAVIDWKAPARLDEVITITAGVPRWGRSSFDILYRVSRGRTPLAEAVVTYVAVDPATLESRPVPEAVRAALPPAGARGRRG
ncbi:MAG TPA: thioesterase family protein [Dehalococcoidia bacterium]